MHDTCGDLLPIFTFFFFNDPATTEIYTLSLHDALPISINCLTRTIHGPGRGNNRIQAGCAESSRRSEEHTSELQSRLHLVCRLLLEKKKKKHTITQPHEPNIKNFNNATQT